MFKNRLFLPFYAADGGGGAAGAGEPGAAGTNPDNTKSTGGDPGNPAGGVDNNTGTTPPAVTFTPEQQALVNSIVADRVAREKNKQTEAEEAARAAAEAKALADNNQFKELAEAREKELEKLRAERLDVKKEALLTKAGYDEAQVTRFKKFLIGTTDEELAANVDELKQDVPPKAKFVDPKAGNGGRQTPPPEDKTEVGRSTYQRLKKAKSIRR